MTASPPCLLVDKVSHSYGRRQALAAVELAVAPGQFHVLLGVNGAGKTTLFNLITRLFDTREGRIQICGHDLSRAPRPALAKLGVVFQSRALDTSLTVAQNLIYQGALHGIARREALARGGEILGRMGLDARMGETVARLSGGQLRRVEIARALLHGPRLLLCDEATVGLDVKSRREIVADLHRLTEAGETGILWTTHLIDEIAPEDPVTVLHQGAVKARGSAAEIAGDGALADAFLALTAEAA